MGWERLLLTCFAPPTEGRPCTLRKPRPVAAGVGFTATMVATSVYRLWVVEAHREGSLSPGHTA